MENNKLRLTISSRYKSYMLFLNKIKEKDLFKILNEDDFEYKLTGKLKEEYEKLFKIKISMINNVKEKQTKLIDIDKKKMYLRLNDINLYNEKFLKNKKTFLVDNQKTTLYESMKNTINEVAVKIHKGKIDIDNIISIFKLHDLSRNLVRNSEERYKLTSFRKSNKTLLYDMGLMIYGRDFENLNKKYLEENIGQKIRKAPSFKEWNDLNSKRQYNDYVAKEEKKGNKKYLSYKDFLYSDSSENQVLEMIPSIDLIATDKNNKETYIENKNYQLYEEKNSKKNILDIKIAYNPNHQVKKLKKLEKLRKYDCETIFNINLHNEKNNKTNTYLIPVIKYKEFYEKISNDFNTKMKTILRDKNNKNIKTFNFNLFYKDLDLPFTINFKNNPSIKNLSNEEASFVLRFDSIFIFNKIFGEYKLKEESTLSNDSNMEI